MVEPTRTDRNIALSWCPLVAVFPSNLQLFVVFEAWIDGVGSVSYTHLDVYKRQNQLWITSLCEVSDGEEVLSRYEEAKILNISLAWDGLWQGITRCV